MRRKILIISAIFSLIISLPYLTQATSVFEVESDTATRNSLQLEGGYVEDLAVDADGVVWVALNSPNGLFYSEDNVNWVAPPSGSDFASIGDVEASADSVFAIAGIDLIRSQDTGRSWTELTGVQDVGHTLHYGQNKLFVPTRDGLLHISTDEGETFSDVIVAEEITEVVSIATSNTNSDVYVLALTNSDSSTLYQSTDGGSTWSNTGVVTTSVNAEIIVKPTDENFLVLRDTGLVNYSTDKGANWQTLTSLFSGGIAFSGERIYNGVIYTDDNGASWTQMAASSGNSRLSGDHIAISPVDSQIMYIDSLQGVSKTTDAGASWSDLNTGLYGVTINDVSQSADGATVWVAAHGCLGKSTNFLDEDPTWQYPITANESYDFSYAVWVDPDNTNHVIAGFNDSLQYTEDGGSTWTDTNYDLSDGTVSDVIENNSTLYAAYKGSGVGGVIISTDNGVTWTDSGLSSIPVNALAYDSVGSIYAGVGEENDNSVIKRGVYKYNGSAWTQLSGGIEGYLVNDILIVNDTIFAAAGETTLGGVFRSTNSGLTWEDFTANGLAEDGWYHALISDPSNDATLLVSTARPAGTGKIYKTMDSGDTWYEFYTGLKDETFTSMMYSTTASSTATTYNSQSTDKNLGIISGTNTGLYYLYSKALVTLKPRAKTISQDEKVRLVATLKDSATKKVLKNKVIKLYRRYKKGGEWKLVKVKKTNNKGQAIFHRSLAKNSYFMAAWLPKRSNVVANYGKSQFQSKKAHIKLK